MSDRELDALADSARNRGLKLVRSRVRTPAKRRFGKVGLTDAAGKPAFGMDSKGPTANPEAVEEFLRGLTANDWGASLDKAPGKRTRKARPRPKPKPKPKPKSQIRDAKPGDAAALAALIALLGHSVDAKGVRKRVSALVRDKLAPLVATLDKKVVGLCGIGRMAAIHRERPVGRINILVVDESLRGEGIGRMLCDAAERRLREFGCGLVEVTSNDRLTEAHAFYRHMGYERTSLRFCKTL